MKKRSYFSLALVALACAALATFMVITRREPRQTALASEVGVQQVFVEFRGPWAFAPDPEDANSVLAIAPKAKGHRDLYVEASNQSTLASGIYDLSLPAHSGTAAATADPAIAQVKIDAQSLQHALDSKSARYVIRLPKPEEYVVAGRHRSRMGATYPPDASTEKDYATATSLRFNVSSMNGFSLAGTLDNGTFSPLLLQVETPTILFDIAPAQYDDPNDKCNTHSRESFRNLTRLLGLTLFVDFPDNPGDCHKSDPQNAYPVKADGSWKSPFEQLAAIDIRNVEQRLLAAVYFFDHEGGDCESPHIILNTIP
jgi:hypothetical protein